MKKVVIAIDSFKGCLPSAEAGKAAAEGIRSVYPECEVICLPIADGGEGMLDVLIMATNGQEVPIFAHYSPNIFSEILFYRLSLYIRYLQIFSFGLNTHEISRF